MVLVPGLLCNFGWEVTIKIHYSTVSGGGHSNIYIYVCVGRFSESRLGNTLCCLNKVFYCLSTWKDFTFSPWWIKRVSFYKRKNDPLQKNHYYSSSLKNYPGKRSQTVSQGTWRRNTKLDSASSSCEGLCRRSCARSPWQVLSRTCCARSFFYGYQYNVSIAGLQGRSLQEVSWQDLGASSLKKNLPARSLWETSWQNLCKDLYKRSLGKISLCKRPIRGLLARSLEEISVQAI